MRVLPPIVGGRGISVRSRADAADGVTDCGTASPPAGAWSRGFRTSGNATTGGTPAAVAGIAARVGSSGRTPDLDTCPSVISPGNVLASRGAGNVGDSRLAPLWIGG